MSTPVTAGADAVADAAATAVQQPSVAHTEHAVQAAYNFEQLPEVQQTGHDIGVAVSKARRGVATSEFWVAIAAVITDVTTDIGSKDKLVAALLAGAYAVARGLAKSG